MGFFMTVMTLRSALKLGLLRARKRQDENGKKTTKDEVFNEEKCNHKHVLVQKHAITSRAKRQFKDSNMLRATAMTSFGAIGEKVMI